MEFTHTAGNQYKVTGVDTHGRRFRIITANPMHAMSINLWRGTRWMSTDGKTWHKIASVYN